MKYATISCTTEACSHKWATYVKFFFYYFYMEDMFKCFCSQEFKVCALYRISH